MLIQFASNHRVGIDDQHSVGVLDNRVITLIADLDRSRFDVMWVSQQPLVDLKATLSEP